MVVKIGSSTVVGADGKVNRAFIGGLADQAAALRKLGWRLVVVSSGAIACGYPVLGFDRKPVGDLPSLQACASAGQCIISSAYDEEFHARDLLTSLVLLTRHDTARRTSYLHARDALLRLVDLGVVPVVNENDTVTVDELKLGDNDNLAAFVAVLVDADALFIATDIDGFYTANPRTNADAQPIEQVEALTPEFFAMAGGAGSSAGTGGMRTKLEAAAKAAAAGVETFLFNGTQAHAVSALAQGKFHGTRFSPAQNRVAARKYWLRNVPLEAGSILVDAGAARAMAEKGASLLPGGVAGAQGDFRRGDMIEVRLRDEQGNERGIARGVSQYSAVDIRRIARSHSRDIEGILGYNYGENVIHRDDLVLL